MLLAAVLLVLVAAGLFVAGLAQGSAALQWGSFASSATAAVVLAASALARRVAPRRALGPAVRSQVPADAGPEGAATGAHAVGHLPAGGVAGVEPPVEEVAVADLLLVLDLTTDVLVVDEHPRYHLRGCPHLAGAQTVPLPMVEARTDGFTPCAVCTPDHVLAERERTRRTA